MDNVPQNMRLQRNDPRRIWLDGVRCYEGSDLQMCGRNEFGVTDCDHDNDVFVKCEVGEWSYSYNFRRFGILKHKQTMLFPL